MVAGFQAIQPFPCNHPNRSLCISQWIQEHCTRRTCCRTPCRNKHCRRTSLMSNRNLQRMPCQSGIYPAMGHNRLRHCTRIDSSLADRSPRRHRYKFRLPRSSHTPYTFCTIQYRACRNNSPQRNNPKRSPCRRRKSNRSATPAICTRQTHYKFRNTHNRDRRRPRSDRRCRLRRFLCGWRDMTCIDPGNSNHSTRIPRRTRIHNCLHWCKVCHWPPERCCMPRNHYTSMRIHCPDP